MKRYSFKENKGAVYFTIVCFLHFFFFCIYRHLLGEVIWSTFFPTDVFTSHRGTTIAWHILIPFWPAGFRHLALHQKQHIISSAVPVVLSLQQNTHVTSAMVHSPPHQHRPPTPPGQNSWFSLQGSLSSKAVQGLLCEPRLWLGIQITEANAVTLELHAMYLTFHTELGWVSF